MAMNTCFKSTVNAIIFLTCLIVFYFLFSLESASQQQETRQNRKHYYFNSEKLFELQFEYVINSSACDDQTNSEILVLILVTSFFGNVETRSAMRRSFTQLELKNFKVRRVFMLGIAPDNKYITQNAILDESRRFGDIIQGNFKEAYRNLTYKHVMGLRWAAKHCGNTKYVIKMDDDTVIDVLSMVKILGNLGLSSKNTIAGYILNGMKPIREPVNKWFVSNQEYPESFYPTFVSGWFYVTTTQVCSQISALSEKVPYFWIDDVYVTGILAKLLKLGHQDISQYFTVHPEFLRCCIKDFTKFKYECEFLVGPNGGDNNLFYDFNKAAVTCFYSKCTRRINFLNETCIATKVVSIGKGNASIEAYPLF